MKLELDEHEVLALYRHLISTHATEPDVYDLDRIRLRVQNHILDCLAPRKQQAVEVRDREKTDDLLTRWEEGVKERLAELKATPESSENLAFDVTEDYESPYPKSFKRSRGGRYRKKK